MRKVFYVLLIVLLSACNGERPAAFSQDVLNEKFLTLDEQTITFKEILVKHKGKKIMFELCASWCAECISGIPDIKKLKAENPDVVFVFLSIDKTIEQWKKGKERFFDIEGDHYFLPAGLKGGYAKGLGIDDVPSYMVVNEKGITSLAHVAESIDPRMKVALSK